MYERSTEIQDNKSIAFHLNYLKFNIKIRVKNYVFRFHAKYTAGFIFVDLVVFYLFSESSGIQLL